MRRKVAIILVVIMMSHVMYVSAETEGKVDDIPETVLFEADETVMEPETATVSGNTVLGVPESENFSETVAELETEESENSVPVLNLEQTSTEESEETEVETESERIRRSAQENVIYNVSFPTDIHAFLDPGNLSGQGQVFSDTFDVENYGNTDIAILIKNMDIRYLSEEEVYELSEEEIGDAYSHVKKMNVNMIWRNESEDTEKILHVMEGETDERVLVLRAAEYDENGEFVKLAEGGTGAFYFTGTLNSNPDIVWEEGEMMVHFSYEVVSLDMDSDSEKDKMSLEYEETSEQQKEEQTENAG